ncbi:MAG: CDP-glycerol glycerophosphotransferase family protein [Simkania negevensis]|nr:CDP-glycerol glycerophosphotransferase family protein [Simkania negevensis]
MFFKKKRGIKPHLVKNIPDHYNLIVKLHPNLKADLYKMEKIIHEAENKPNLLILKEFPLIYPLLNSVSIYLGDMSSIGYDFLKFNKPMFFLNQNQRDLKKDKGLYLFQCGVSIERHEYNQIFQIIEKNLPKDQERYQKIREEVYCYVFGKGENEKHIKERVRKEVEEVLDERFDLF